MDRSKTIPVAGGKVHIGGKAPAVLIAGPCVIESEEQTLGIAGALKKISIDCQVDIIFKASFDKANRTSLQSFRGIGMEKGLDILREVRKRYDLPVLSDVHEPGQVEKCAAVLDVIQIPALLCRQTDLLTEAGATGKAINVKKGQFLSPWDMAYVVEKIVKTGNEHILLTERGTSFGYGNLVVDFRSFSILRTFGFPVIFDVTHSVQLPGGGRSSRGEADFIPDLARAAAASGVDAFFMEVYRDGTTPLCDADNSYTLSALATLLPDLLHIGSLIRKTG